MYGLLDVDVTLGGRLLAATEPPSSMTAFIAASVARVAAAHPEVHAYRDWRERLVSHRFVDVSTMVEVFTAQGPFAIPHTLRDADVRSVADLSEELRHVKAAPLTSPNARWAERHAPWANPPARCGPRRLRRHGQIGRKPSTDRDRCGDVRRYVRCRRGLRPDPLTLMSLELIVGGSANNRVLSTDRSSFGTS